MHSTFAGVAIAVFSLLGVAYLLWFVENSAVGARGFFQAEWFAPAWRMLRAFGRFVRTPLLAALMALVGLVALTITGGLGAAIVYGPAIDPFVGSIYHLFF